MKNQPSRPYTAHELKKLLGIEDSTENSSEMMEAMNLLLGHNFTESNIGFYTITDYSTLKYLYVSPKVMQVTGYTAEAFMKGGPEFMLSLSHPEEKESIWLIHEKIVSFFNSLPDEKKLDYCYCYHARMRTIHGDYILVLCELEGELLRKNGHLLIGKEMFTEIPSIENYLHFNLTIRHKNKMSGIPDQVFHFKKPLKNELTRREREIDERAENGQTSKEISEDLHISVNTVETHRRRISKKRKRRK